MQKLTGKYGEAVIVAMLHDNEALSAYVHQPGGSGYYAFPDKSALLSCLGEPVVISDIEIAEIDLHTMSQAGLIALSNFYSMRIAAKYFGQKNE